MTPTYEFNSNTVVPKLLLNLKPTDLRFLEQKDSSATQSFTESASEALRNSAKDNIN